MTSTIPRVPHLPGSRLGNSDLIVPDHEHALFLQQPVLVVEKLDGVALTFFTRDDEIDVAMKSDWKGALAGAMHQSARRWLAVHADRVAPLVADGQQLYGEWLHHRLFTPYDALPGAVIIHGWRDAKGRLRPRHEVNRAAKAHGLPCCDPLFEGTIGTRSLASLLPKRSAYGSCAPEGLVVETLTRDGARWAKWVAPHYRQPKGHEVQGALNRVLEPR